jgi:hypothetical protein
VGNATAIATNIVINWAMIVDRILGMSGIFSFRKAHQFTVVG